MSETKHSLTKEEKRREQRRVKRRREERGVYLFCGFFATFLVVLGALSYYLVGYALADREYRDLSKKYVIFEDAQLPYRAQSGTAYAAEQGEETAGADYPALQIDFAALSELNDDFIGWIYLPGAACSYPLVQTQDNDYYLDHTFEDKTSSSGAIFVDYRDSAFFTGFNTFIYGHNMKNGSMFGDLRDFCQNTEKVTAEPYFYIYLPDETVMKYQIFSWYLTDGDSDSYDRPENLTGEDAYLQKIKQKASVKVDLEENRIGTYVTLSTCAGAAGSGQRFLVHGACVGIY